MWMTLTVVLPFWTSGLIQVTTAKNEAVGLLLDDASHEIMFTHFDFISRLIEKAYAIGGECYNSVVRVFTSKAMAGERSGKSGEPFPTDLYIFEESNKLLQTLGTGTPVHRLFASLSEYAKEKIERKKVRDEEIFG